MYAFQIEKAQIDWMDEYMEYQEKVAYKDWEKVWDEQERVRMFKEDFMKGLAQEKFRLDEEDVIYCASFDEAIHIVDAYDNDPVVMYDTAYGWSVYWNPYKTGTNTDGWTFWIERKGVNRYRVHNRKLYNANVFYCDWPLDCQCEEMTYDEVLERAERMTSDYLDWLEEDEEENENE